MRGLRDKVAIITGAASPIGMGFATATRLAEEGARVVLTDINHAGVVERASELQRAGHRAVGLAHDATDEAAWEEVLRATKAEFGSLDIVVNNAAITTLNRIVDMPLNDWRRVMDVNSSITFLGCRIAAREMQAAGKGGAIVNVCSTASLTGGETAGAYCASKAAVQMLTKVLALETAKYGIRVNSVHPGYTATEMLSGAMDDGNFAEVVAGVPAGRLGKPSEMAAAIAFLASEDATYCNGSSLFVDGGLTSQ